MQELHVRIRGVPSAVFEQFPGELSLGLVGSGAALGDWGKTRPIRLTATKQPGEDTSVYEGRVDVPKEETPLLEGRDTMEYRLVLIDSSHVIAAVENSKTYPSVARLASDGTVWRCDVDLSLQSRPVCFTRAEDGLPFVGALSTADASRAYTLSLSLYANDPSHAYNRNEWLNRLPREQRDLHTHTCHTTAFDIVSVQPVAVPGAQWCTPHITESDEGSLSSEWCVRPLRHAAPVVSDSPHFDSARTQSCWNCLVRPMHLHAHGLEIAVVTTHHPADSVSAYRGSTVILPSMIKSSTNGVFALSVPCRSATDANSVQWVSLYVQYIVVHPFVSLPDGHNNDLHTVRSLESHEGLTLTTLAGHRGLGKTFTRSRESKGTVVKLMENTIEAFTAAHKRGCEMVELDAMLTRDRVPVVFHDPFIQVHSALMTEQPSFLFESIPVPIHSLTRDALSRIAKESYSFSSSFCRLKRLLLRHWPHIIPIARSHGEEESHHRALCGCALRHCADIPVVVPTLAEVLTQTPLGLRMNIEVKYPFMPQWDAHMYYQQDAFDINEFVDCILEVVFQHAGTREIAFSSFEPDVCIALSVKQSRYDVLFLSDTAEREDLKDYRSFYIEGALQFASLHSLSGISMAASTLSGPVPSPPPLSSCGPTACKENAPLAPKVPLVKRLLGETVHTDCDGLLRYKDAPGKDIVQEAHRRSLKVWTWGEPNSDHHFGFLQGEEMGVDAIISDNTLLL